MENTINKIARYAVYIDGKHLGSKGLMIAVVPFQQVENILSSLPSTEERKTAEDIKTDFYRRFGAGDFQNDTDLLDVDKAWEWFSQQTEAMDKELSEAKKEIDRLVERNKQWEVDYEKMKRDDWEHTQKLVNAVKNECQSAMMERVDELPDLLRLAAESLEIQAEQKCRQNVIAPKLRWHADKIKPLNPTKQD